MKRISAVISVTLIFAVAACKKHTDKPESGAGENSLSAPPAPAPPTKPSPTPSPSPGSSPTPSPSPAPSPNPVPPGQGASQFGIYNDAGGILSDPDVQAVRDLSYFAEFGGSFSFSETTGDAAEGTRYWAVQDQASVSGLSVNYRKRGSDKTVDLSAFRNGVIRFSIRLHRALPFSTANGNSSDLVFLRINDLSAPGMTVNLEERFGFNGSSLGWQEVSVPLSSWSVNFSRIQEPFAIGATVFNQVGRDPTIDRKLDFDVDNIRWEKGITPI